MEREAWKWRNRGVEKITEKEGGEDWKAEVKLEKRRHFPDSLNDYSKRASRHTAPALPLHIPIPIVPTPVHAVGKSQHGAKLVARKPPA